MAVVLCLPVIASTQIVRDSVAQQVSAWSGYRVRLDEAPEIHVWPAFEAVLNDVDLSDWNDSQDGPVLEADEVAIELSALAALRGEVVFTKIRLVRPTIHVDAAKGPAVLRTMPQWGRLARSVELARELVAANPTEPDVSALPSDPFGVIEFVDGRVVADDPAHAGPVMSELNGTFSWPALNRQASLTTSGRWHGENLSLEASAAQPLLLLAGGTGALSAALNSAPVTASFSGQANFSDNPFINGQLQASAPSLERLAEWAMREDWPNDMIRSVTLNSAINGTPQRVKFEDAQIGLDDNGARGVFDITFGDSQPTVTGTLAFDALHFEPLLATLAPDPAAVGQPLESPFSGNANLDLRLSAATASAGPIAMTDVAATAQVKDSLVSLDISDATAFGGMVQIGLRLDDIEERNHAELRMTAENIDGAAVNDALALGLPLPQATGSFSVFLQGHGENLADILETADGTVSASFGAGTIPGIDLAAFRARNGTGEFFPLSDISDGALTIESATLDMTFSGGIAWVDDAQAHLGAETITVGGLVPVAGHGIALSGSIGPAVDEDTDERPAGPRETFFVGGSWKQPYIAPFLVE